MFESYDIADGVRAHILRDERFRRVHVQCFFNSPLLSESASGLALLPSVLARGTARMPEADLIARGLSRLYGARMGTGTSKSGDRQVTYVSLNVSNDKYAGVPVLGEGLDFVNEVVSSPWLPGGAFSADYVEQEKMQLIGRIRAIINDKARYATEKGLRYVYDGEPAALSADGTVEGVEAITAETLASQYERLIGQSPLEIYVVGDVDPAAAVALVGARFALRNRRPIPAVRSTVSRGGGQTARFFETEPMEQGWLIMGIKSGIAMGTDQRWVLAMVNGVLGVFPHSKLFVNVREKASLAYTARSGLNSAKGTIIATAGIDPANYRRASDLMVDQLAAIGRGEVDEAEFGATREGMVAGIQGQVDSPGYLIATHFSAMSEGCYEDVASSVQGIGAVTRQQVIDLAGELKPDTIFFLSGMAEDLLLA